MSAASANKIWCLSAPPSWLGIAVVLKTDLKPIFKKKQQQHHFLFSKQNVYFDVHTALIPIPFSTQMKDLKNNDFLILYSNKNIWNHVCPVCLSTSTGWAYGYVIYDQLGSDTSKLRCSWYLNRKSPNLGWCFKFFIIQCHKPPLWKTQ